jgi:imidazolonepropionase-like amidohydrolase
MDSTKRNNGNKKREDTGVNMAQSILFKNARLIDSIADHPLNGVSILSTAERIAAVEAGAIPEPAGANVIDLKG